MEPASSSDDDSSSDEDDLQSKIATFEDLPSDDSCSVSSDDSSDDSDSDDDDHTDTRRRRIKNDDSNEESSSDDEDLTLEEKLHARRQNGTRKEDTKESSMDRKKKALRVASQRLATFQSKKNGTRTYQRSDSSKKPKKRSKHAPKEVSSKRKDFFNRGAPTLGSSGLGSTALATNLYKPRDPRMSSLSGNLSQSAFDRNYAFLEEIQDKEIDDLKKRVSARKKKGSVGQRARKKLGPLLSTLEDDEQELTRLNQERSDRRKSQVKRAAKHNVMKKLDEEIAEGKRGVYYPKRKERHRMELEARFEELRKRGGDAAVDKALAKRRKKNSAKDHKLMPPKLHG